MAYTRTATLEVKFAQILQNIPDVTVRIALKQILDLILVELDAIDDEI